MHLDSYYQFLIPLVLAGSSTARLSARHHNATFHGDKRTTPTNKGVTIQMFQWSWDSIAAECRNFIGPAGYGLVEVSPPSEHYQHDAWWAHYQPVSYVLTSKHGNRQQFANMVKACNDAGVGVMVDMIWNHMAGQDSGVGTAGKTFSHYDYPGIYNYQDFHHCGTAGDDIHNWDNRWETQTCELANLADLDTASEKVRNTLVNYSNDLLSLGVTGFRIDAAKHMPIGDIQAIVSRLSRKPFLTQEVVCENGANELCSGEYTGAGEVQEFRY
ncbi:hypothetical protein FRC03_001790 [Tulasnella sp. 419]|nr:hypothetical protein FRC03_001790 [Tulasnella sp. 419]